MARLIVPKSRTARLPFRLGILALGRGVERRTRNRASTTMILFDV
jgi:hypothetical protein